MLAFHEVIQTGYNASMIVSFRKWNDGTKLLSHHVQDAHGGELFEVHPVVSKLGTSCESFRRKTSSRRRDVVGWSSPETELA